MSRAVVRVPQQVRAGEVIEITAMVAHPMETGYRTGDDGRIVPRHIVRELQCEFDGQTVFRMTFFPALTANPWVAFPLRAERSGLLTFTWTDDQGRVVIERAELRVS